MAVTKKEIAEHVGVSRSAVSLVLNNTPSSTISEETRKRILQAAQELGYQEKMATPKICFILYGRSPDDPRYMHDLKVVEHAASKLQYATLFMNIPATAVGHQKLQRFLDKREVEGMIITGDLDDTLIRMIQASNEPYLFYGGTTREDANIMVLDHRKGAYTAVQYLIELGHKRIAFFSGRLDITVHMENLKGYYQALEEAGLSIDKSLIQASKEEDGYELASRLPLLGIEHSAIFCVNTVIQFGALQWLKDTGVAVPSQVSLAGYGFTELVKLSKPELTTVYVDQKEKEKLVDELLDIIRKRKSSTPRHAYLSEMTLHKGGTASIYMP
ncbi:LacI family DNA-binding transcriptional regulator [Paenibacillus oryzisoli]|uniref:LacI family DNA-binding transcriptional regulator n=1 Tax=Paenibacillus oryzisoli TaxID=1850517 RepID=UPI003D2C8CB1